MGNSSFKSSAEYQRENRASLKKMGFKRLDITISPRTWRKLEPYLQDYGVDSHPGAALCSFLDNLEIVD